MKTPQHIGIIPDGNRRFAKRLMKEPWRGHEWGIDKIKTFFDWSKELNIRVLTFYTLSLENLDSRPREELEFLFSLANQEILSILDNPDSFVHRNRVRVKCFGRLDRVPPQLRDNVKALEKATKDYSDYHMNLAIAYGGRQEILDACQKIGRQVASGKLSPQDINELVLKQNLSTNGHPDPDLIIRTGGEKRLSNFLLYQSAYSELAFLDTFWPELTKEEFTQVIQDFSSRDRRFGK